MATNATKEVFGDSMNESMAIQLEIALERVVQVGLELSAARKYEASTLRQGLQIKGAPIIKGILRYIRPEMSKGVRQIDERIIWNIYWTMRSNPMEKRISIFSLLSGLNKNPPHIVS